MFITAILKRLSATDRNFDESHYLSLLPSVDRTAFVPKNLFQICLQNKNGKLLTDDFQEAIKRLQNMNKGWNYRLLDDCQAIEFIRHEYGPGILSYFERISPRYGAARADFLRYLLLYRYGGAYLDIKSGLDRSLDDTTGGIGRFPVFYWDNIPGGNHHPAIPSAIKGGEILQTFIVSPAGHPYLKAVIIEAMKRIDRYNPYSDGVGYGGVMNVTGPGMYTETVYNSCIANPDEGYIARPFADFSFVFRHVPAGLPVGMTDYRKQSSPLVSSGNKLLDAVNRVYLRLLFNKRNYR